MDIEQALQLCRHWQRPRAWYNIFNIRKRQVEICFDIVGKRVVDVQARVLQYSALLKQRTDSLDALSEWMRLNRPDLIAELPVLDWTTTDSEHVQRYCAAMLRVESGILCGPVDSPQVPAASDKQTGKPKRGAKPKYDCPKATEKLIVGGWKSRQGRFKCKADLAKHLELSVELVKAVIDRNRKRQ